MKQSFNEVETIYFMIQLYCKKKHKSKELCNSCNELYEYAKLRIEKCPKKETKTFCSTCTIHCYKTDMRIKIKEVMRFSGPRMLFYKPTLAVSHVCNTMKERKK
ncbi:nitrous oxide-stimulated promoter family protein [Tannockella kyphosi]|uniref:nitrous oxide-stimulated promoter family protein n=1 Tax=Tannockella kyphosi TaxID=2899121 RepID=UPI002010F5C3|nr:nitrous oxide-stimulated promoter family protein [Tannockella kyphosi]